MNPLLPQLSMKPTPGGALLLHRHVPPLTRRYMAYYSSGVLIPHTATEIRMGVHMDYRKRRLLDTVVEPFLASAKGFLVQGE